MVGVPMPEPESFSCSDPKVPDAQIRNSEVIKHNWRRLRTNNLQERTNREIKRRSRVVQVFPSVQSLERLVGAVMCEQDDAWSDARYFSERRISELYEDRPAPEPPTPEQAAELDDVARRAIEASLELADRMEAA